MINTSQRKRKIGASHETPRGHLDLPTPGRHWAVQKIPAL